MTGQIVHFSSGTVCTNQIGLLYPHTRSDKHILLYVLKGKAAARINVSDSVCIREDILQISPDDVFTFFASEPVTYYRFLYDGTIDLPLPSHFHVNDPVQILQLSHQLFRYSREPNCPPLIVDTAMTLLLGEIALQYASALRNETPVFRQICTWIYENADHPITVNDVAQAFTFNVDYVSRLFKRYEPEGLKNYITNARINRVKQMLLTTEYPLKEIAARLRFPDYKLFLKFYSYHEKMSPTEFRDIFSAHSDTI